MTKQLRSTTLNIKTLLPKEGLFSGIHLLPNGFRVVFQAEAHGEPVAVLKGLCVDL